MPVQRVQRSRVFVSSVIEGFESFRTSARSGIEAAGCQPVMVNEDFPSMSTSSRNACLDAVDSADVFILLIGSRGGWRTPSGKLVVEEELHRARGRKLPVLVFIQECERDADGARLVAAVSDYVAGYFRVDFRSPADLQREVARALAAILSALSRPMTNPADINILFLNIHQVADHQAHLRLVVAPARNEEVIDPVKLGSAEFVDAVLRIGHAPDVRLLNYRYPKKEVIEAEALIIEQGSPGRRQDGTEAIKIEIRSTGLITIDSNITGRNPTRGWEMMDLYVLAEEAVEAVLGADLRFCGAFFEAFDPYRRHERFLNNVALSGVGQRRLEKSPQPRSSFAVPMRNEEGPVVVYKEPRLLDRESLNNPTDEIRRVLSLLSRHPALK